MAAQLPVRRILSGPWSVTLRPEIAWDRDARWTGSQQFIKAFTTTLEYKSLTRRRMRLRGSNIASMIRAEKATGFSRAVNCRPAWLA